MRIRRAAVEDATQIWQIEEQTFSIPWSYDAIYKDLQNPIATYFIAEENNQVIGYVGVWCIVDEGQITNVAVHHEHRKQGVAHAIIEELVNFGISSQLYNMSLEVRKGNEAAIALYKKNGFEIVGTRKNYYKQPVEDAYIMIRQM